MRIAQIAPLYESVPPKLYGGTERVVSYLTEALIKLGHEVTLFASADSITQAKLIPICPKSLRLNDTQDALAVHFLEMEKIYQRADQFDIIHNHNDYLAYPLIRRCKIPTLTTLHGRLNIPELIGLYEEYSDIPVVSISYAQREPLPFANWVGNVYHGIPADLYSFVEKPEDYMAFVGRVSSEKKVEAGIEIAKKAHKTFKIAAKVGDKDQQHFEEFIKPHLNDPLIQFIGEVNEKEKNILLGNASAFLFPIDWPEPFGLVLIEALACGTPVIARKRGAIPEVIQDQVTGFIFETDEEAVAELNNILKISRAECRRIFEEKFTDVAMANEYLKIYQQLIDRGTHGR